MHWLTSACFIPAERKHRVCAQQRADSMKWTVRQRVGRIEKILTFSLSVRGIGSFSVVAYFFLILAMRWIGMCSVLLVDCWRFWEFAKQAFTISGKAAWVGYFASFLRIIFKLTTQHRTIRFEKNTWNKEHIQNEDDGGS